MNPSIQKKLTRQLQDVDNIKDTFQETLNLITQFKSQENLSPKVSELVEQLVETTSSMNLIFADLVEEIIQEIILAPSILERQTCEQLPITTPKLIRQNGYLKCQLTN